MSTASTVEREMLALINQERTSRGLDPLQLETQLNDSSEDHSAWMLDTDRFSHTGAGGSSATQRMQMAGFDLEGSWRTGENIAWQSERGAPGISDDVAQLHENLMNSPGHRANILNPDFRYIGIGVETGDMQGYDAVMVTQNFATTSAAVMLDEGVAVVDPVPTPPVEDVEEPVEEDVAEPVEDVDEPVEEDVAEPVEDVDEPAEEDVAEPVEDVVEPVEEDVAEPVEDVDEPVEEDVAEPVEDVDEPVEEDVAEPVEDVDEPAEEDVAEPVEDVDEPVEEDVAEPVEDVDEPAEEDVAEPVEDVDEPAEEDVAEPVEDVVEPVEEDVAEPVEDVDEPVEEDVAETDFPTFEDFDVQAFLDEIEAFVTALQARFDQFDWNAPQQNQPATQPDDFEFAFRFDANDDEVVEDRGVFEDTTEEFSCATVFETNWAFDFG